MNTRRKRNIDLLSVGELLIDFISRDFTDTMEEAANFMRLQGGSPANMCINMARLGNTTQLVASVGKDAMGNYLMDCVNQGGVDTRFVRQVDTPTTLILVTRSKATSDFEAYRGADTQINLEQFPLEDLSRVSIFHTTCFALSMEPARSNILEAARRAVQAGCQLSIDVNYAPKIWSDQQQAQKIVADYCQMGALIKVSDVDWKRLYGNPISSGKEAIQHFLNLGAKSVCLTLGKEGCLIGAGQETYFLPTRPVEVKDTTGTGDAFWSGFLTAWLDGYQIKNCGIAGRRMAEIKLGHFGPLPGKVKKEQIYEDCQ